MDPMEWANAHFDDVNKVVEIGTCPCLPGNAAFAMIEGLPTKLTFQCADKAHLWKEIRLAECLTHMNEKDEKKTTLKRDLLGWLCRWKDENDMFQGGSSGPTTIMVIPKVTQAAPLDLQLYSPESTNSRGSSNIATDPPLIEDVKEDDSMALVLRGDHSAELVRRPPMELMEIQHEHEETLGVARGQMFLRNVVHIAKRILFENNGILDVTSLALAWKQGDGQGMYYIIANAISKHMPSFVTALATQVFIGVLSKWLMTRISQNTLMSAEQHLRLNLRSLGENLTAGLLYNNRMNILPVDRENANRRQALERLRPRRQSPDC